MCLPAACAAQFHSLVLGQGWGPLFLGISSFPSNHNFSGFSKEVHSAHSSCIIYFFCKSIFTQSLSVDFFCPGSIHIIQYSFILPMSFCFTTKIYRCPIPAVVNSLLCEIPEICNICFYLTNRTTFLSPHNRVLFSTSFTYLNILFDFPHITYLYQGT